MKTKEELTAIKAELDNLKGKLAELSEEELEEVTGGTVPELPATTLEPWAYNGMFHGDPGLAPAHELPAAPVIPNDPV